MYFPHSKPFHMTMLVASPQNVRSCTHILPITEDKCSKLPMCSTVTLLSSFRSFLSCIFFPVCASYVARICVTFNYPPIVLALPMQLFNSKQSALLFFTQFFAPFFFLLCLLFACSDRAASVQTRTVCVSFLIFLVFCLGEIEEGGGGVFGCERIIVFDVLKVNLKSSVDVCLLLSG
jgi:hypothetical protein